MRKSQKSPLSFAGVPAKWALQLGYAALWEVVRNRGYGPLWMTVDGTGRQAWIIPKILGAKLTVYVLYAPKLSALDADTLSNPLIEQMLDTWQAYAKAFVVFSFDLDDDFTPLTCDDHNATAAAAEEMAGGSGELPYLLKFPEELATYLNRHGADRQPSGFSEVCAEGAVNALREFGTGVSR